MCSSGLSPDNLVSTFGLDDCRYVYIIGSGGKTTLMLTIAEALSALGRRVVATTSTKLAHPEPSTSYSVLIEPRVSTLVTKLRQRRAGGGYAIAGKSVIENGVKIGGYSLAELDALHGSEAVDCCLVEGDGAASRSLKAHMDYEPVVSPQAELVIAVVGIDCIGKPVTEEHVHRADRFRQLLHLDAAAPITVEAVANIIVHSDGYLAKVRECCPIVLFINKVNDADGWQNACQLATLIRPAGPSSGIRRILAGTLLPSNGSIRAIDDRPTL